MCSGHGRCTTDDVECGKGSSTKKATPCCTCELGFAGEGCAELDARMYVAIFVLTIAAMMLTSMLLISIGRRSTDPPMATMIGSSGSGFFQF